MTWGSRTRLICAWLAGFAATVAWAVPNNGFETDYVYVTRDAGQGGHLKAFEESTGLEIATIQPDGSNWATLTFAGSGANDARLFVAKADGLDVTLAEVDAVGNVLKTTTLSSIVGGSIGTAVSVGTLRYDKVHDSLIVSVNPNLSASNTSTPGVAYEIDLGLATCRHTYIGGTNILDRDVKIDVDPADGTIYMVNRHMNGLTNKGDLIAFNTAGRILGGTTSTYTTLINGETVASTTPALANTDWDQPEEVICRKANPADGTPTVILLMNNNGAGNYALEFFRNTTVHPLVNGNLAYRGTAGLFARGWRGQQDEVTGDIWLGCLRGGFHAFKANDTVVSYETSRYWVDADSPAYTGAVPPVITEVSPDPGIAPTGSLYQRQLVLSQGTQPVTWSLVAAPPGAQISSSGLVSGWTPSAAEAGQLVSFTARAQNGQGFDNETWQVYVMNGVNGFLVDAVYVARTEDQGGHIRMFSESDGTSLGDFTANGTNWHTLTFAGTGRGSDARLFAVRAVSSTTDLEVAELNGAGQVVKSALLSTIIGSAVGPAIDLGDIRYSSYHKSLFIAANTNTAAMSPATAWEIDLNLATRLHTYEGPAVLARRVNVDINARDGSLYMVAEHMTDPTLTGKGDVIRFDAGHRVAGGKTTTYTTLIDGLTFYGTDPRWNGPASVIYRRRAAAENDTLAVVINQNPGPVLEFYLDTAAHPIDASGNLAVLPNTLLNVQRGWNGQQDEATGDIWIGALRGGVHAIRSDDSTMSVELGRQWLDADSPPYEPCNDPFADIDGDGDVDMLDFAVFQRCVDAGQPEMLLVAECRCFDRNKNNDLDSQDMSKFATCASGASVPANAACDD